MKIENVKIIHTEDISITFNTNETNFENVFILDENYNNINNITYACPIYFDKNIVFRNLVNRTIKVDNVFLFYSFMYQIAFCHFVEQTLPKLMYYFKLKNDVKDVKFCIPKKRYNLITKNIIKLLNIPEEDLIILDHNTAIHANCFYYNNYDCGDFNIDKIETFNLLRENLLIRNNLTYNRNVYLRRDTKITIDTDCHNIGKTRQIINEDNLIDTLKKLNFEIITLGENNIL